MKQDRQLLRSADAPFSRVRRIAANSAALVANVVFSSSLAFAVQHVALLRTSLSSAPRASSACSSSIQTQLPRRGVEQAAQQRVAPTPRRA